MAQIASSIQIQENQSKRTVKVQRKFSPSIISKGMNLEINTNEVHAGDWRKPLIDYLSNPSPMEAKCRVSMRSFSVRMVFFLPPHTSRPTSTSSFFNCSWVEVIASNI
ncbi:hypothetical protein GBA52_010443 [Prunus armeniaca]|nr:hypothetical protein GBA52_010443 [Prunus armeniaca]